MNSPGGASEARGPTKPSLSHPGIALSTASADTTELQVAARCAGAPDRGGGVREETMAKRTLVSIVEDDQPFRESMKKLVGLLGYAVEAFPSAGDFLKSAFVGQTDCLVADVQMPGMTGVELHKRLVEAGHAIPTILVTAYPSEAVRNRALKDGVVCYLPKPVDDDHLEHCLRSALSGEPPHEH
jgi:CheY-like chemotaxis protein